jgi:hypothetical protein
MIGPGTNGQGPGGRAVLTLIDRLRSNVIVLRLAKVAFWAACVVVTGAASIPKEDHPPDPFGWDKANHFVAFYGLAVLGIAAFPRLAPWVIGAWLAALGGLIELIQLIPAIHRDADIVDWLVDSAGIIAALAPLAVAAWRASFPSPANPRR